MDKQRLIDVDALIVDIKKGSKENFEKLDWSSKDVCKILEEAVKQPHLQPKSQWISVEEGLPNLTEYLKENPSEQGVEVIVFIEGAERSTTLIYDGDNFCEPTDMTTTYRVTHWMPFPDIPKISDEIVRCRECKKWDRSKRMVNNCACSYWSASSLKKDLRFTPPDGFCCYAVKEEGVKNE